MFPFFFNMKRPLSIKGYRIVIIYGFDFALGECLNPMKPYTLLFLLVFVNSISAQQNYIGDSKFRKFGPRNGNLDSASRNPSKESPDSKVVKYDRSNSVSYDNIKIYPNRKLTNIEQYATYEGNPPKISLNLYSTAPVGTKVEIQLGKKGDDNYPSGVHSQYEAYTTRQNEWERLTFKFSQMPKGSKVKPTEVDKITLLFSPNSQSGDTYYFDDLNGPPMVAEQK